MSEISDGVIIGSAIVKIIGKYGEDCIPTCIRLCVCNKKSHWLIIQERDLIIKGFKNKAMKGFERFPFLAVFKYTYFYVV